jgi:SAM-dependent methyltransferase
LVSGGRPVVAHTHHVPFAGVRRAILAELLHRFAVELFGQVRDVTGMVRSILEHPLGYRLWQRPFADQKLEPVLRHNDMDGIRRVLDVGCGPGTNTSYFASVDYIGIDWNERYVAEARRRYGREFVAADVTKYRVDAQERFDFILVNSLLHHLDDEPTRSLLEHLAGLLTPDGHIHILDLVLPDQPGIARQLAHWDRGDHARPLARWRELFEASFSMVEFEPYRLGAAGITLWEMVYFKGRGR